MMFTKTHGVNIMNIQECDLLREIRKKPDANQRVLSEKTGYSLGMVNKCIQNLIKQGMLRSDGGLSDAACTLFTDRMPERAVILAAGFGMRMVPINLETPKALLEVHGERLIERQIRQLKEAGIRDITVVVGFMKECFEYLMDSYGVELCVNPFYNRANNLYSLSLAADKLKNCYVIPSDLYFLKNPFRKDELYSWYMINDRMTRESSVRLNRKHELVSVDEHEAGNGMIGLAYLTGEESSQISARLMEMRSDVRYAGLFWESALEEKGKYRIWGRVFPASDAVEINTYEQLREVDEGAAQLKSDAMDTIAAALHTVNHSITGIEVLKKGMTNRSFLFSCGGQRYIMRIPGEGSDKMINRYQEAEVYRTIEGKGLCDSCIYLNPDNGYKITRYIEGVRNCDPLKEEDIARCMKKLREFHAMNLVVRHVFDPFAEMERYESFWNGKSSVYRDHAATKQGVYALRPFIDAHIRSWHLCHIDSVCDNFLFYPDGKGGELLQLTDWEYAGMQDPDMDIAMFCIYALYDRKQIDHLIDLYYEGKCPREIRIKIYCYIAVCGMLWSNWCELKRFLGVEFGEYALKQYRYAKDYMRLAQREMKA